MPSNPYAKKAPSGSRTVPGMNALSQQIKASTKPSTIVPTATSSSTPPSSIVNSRTSGGVGTTGTASAASIPTTGGVPGKGTDPMSVGGQGVVPGMLPMLQNDPQAILANIFSNRGWNQMTSPLYGQLSNLISPDAAQSLFMLMQGNQPSAYTNGANLNESYGNFLNGLYQQMMAPGGRGVDFRELLQNMQGSGAESPLQTMLTAGGPQYQVGATQRLLADAADMSMPRLFANAYQAMIGRLGDQYLQQNLYNQSGQDVSPFYQWLGGRAAGF